MAKDPAFLFYPGDWIGGTMGMTFEEKGAYMELLMLQFNRGHMTTDMIGRTVGQLWDNIKDKFIEDADGLFFNERLELEKTKRKAYTTSRKNNLTGKNQYSKKEGHTTSRMEDKDKDVDSSVITSDIIKELENSFSMKQNVGQLLKTTPKVIDIMLADFIQEQKAKDDLDRNLRDLRSHFVSWAKKTYKKEMVKPNSRYNVGEVDYNEKWSLNKS